MSQIIQELLKVFAIDKELIQLKKLIEAGPEEIRLQEEKVAAAREERRQAEQFIKTRASEVDTISLDIRTAESELNNQEGKIGSIKNNKEYKIVTDRIKELKQEIEDLETKVLNRMEELEEFKSGLQERLGAISESEEKIQGLRDEVEKEATEIKARAQELKAKRDPQLEAVRELNPNAIEAYKLAFRRGYGLSMAEMIKGTCQSCFRRASPNIESIVIVGREIKRCACAGCGRILYIDQVAAATEES